jgi:hypothetical protein
MRGYKLEIRKDAKQDEVDRCVKQIEWGLNKQDMNVDMIFGYPTSNHDIVEFVSF